MLCSRIAERRFVARQIKPQAGEKATQTHETGYRAYTCVMGRFINNLFQNNMAKRFRIVTGEGYDGCLPITVYWVQKLEEKTFTSKWINIKGFDTYSRAKELLVLLS